MIAKQTDQQLRILLQTMYQGRIVIRVKRVVENGIMNYLILTDKRKKGFQKHIPISECNLYVIGLTILIG